MSAGGKEKDGDKKDGAQAESADGAAPKSKKMLFIIGGVVVLLTLGGIGAFVGMSGGDANAKMAEEEVKEEPPLLKRAKIDTFIANLSENTTFVKVGIVVEYDATILNRIMDGLGEGGGHGYGGGAGGGAKKEDPMALPPLMIEREPMIRHAIIKTLSSRRSTDILTAEGKEELRADLVTAINEAISDEESPIVQVYFTEFIIQ
jgi:flagellar FliL protein